jgi:hypothetical protein
MQKHLAEIRSVVAPSEHPLIILDQAGLWVRFHQPVDLDPEIIFQDNMKPSVVLATALCSASRNPMLSLITFNWSRDHHRLLITMHGMGTCFE